MFKNYIVASDSGHPATDQQPNHLRHSKRHVVDTASKGCIIERCLEIIRHIIDRLYHGQC